MRARFSKIIKKDFRNYTGTEGGTQHAEGLQMLLLRFDFYFYDKIALNSLSAKFCIAATNRFYILSSSVSSIVITNCVC